MADDQDRTEEQNGGDAGSTETRSRRILTDIAPHSWEHPADKAALQALRRAVREAVSTQVVRIELVAAPDVITLLQGALRPALVEAQDLIKGDIKLSSRPDFGRSRIEVHAG